MMSEIIKVERRKKPTFSGCPYLSDEQLEMLAEKAAEKAVEKMTAMVYQEVGKGIISKVLWLVGVVTVSLALWLHSKGFFQ